MNVIQNEIDYLFCYQKGKWMYVIGSGKFNKIKLLDLQY
jgi:hypothetical protein